MKWSNNFPISWPNLTMGWCCSFHKKLGMINRKTVAVSVAQYYIMGNTQDQKTHFFSLVQSGDKSNKFSLEYRLCIANWSPQSRMLSLIFLMPNTNLFLSFSPLFLFSSHFSFFPIFSWFFLDISFSPGTYLLKLFSRKEDKDPTSQRNLYV